MLCIFTVPFVPVGLIAGENWVCEVIVPIDGRVMRQVPL